MINESESGIDIIDEKFTYYFLRYINAHRHEFNNSYELGEWLISSILQKAIKSKVPNKERMVLAIKYLMKNFNIKKFFLEVDND